MNLVVNYSASIDALLASAAKKMKYRVASSLNVLINLQLSWLSPTDGPDLQFKVARPSLMQRLRPEYLEAAMSAR